MPPAFIPINTNAFAVVDHELVVLMASPSSFERPLIFGTAFKTRTGAWRLLRLGAVDIGYASDPAKAVERLVKDASEHPKLYPFPLSYHIVELEALVVGSLPI